MAAQRVGRDRTDHAPADRHDDGAAGELREWHTGERFERDAGSVATRAPPARLKAPDTSDQFARRHFTRRSAGALTWLAGGAAGQGQGEAYERLASEQAAAMLTGAAHCRAA